MTGKGTSLAVIAVLATIVVVLPLTITSQITSMEKRMTHNKLTPEEERVIVHKGTEAPFSGSYCTNTAAGTYVCKRCDAPLYRSDDKFDAACGWPGFDDEIVGAVTRSPDADGIRTEITCTRCGAHLGHVFTGEGLTPKNIRHCVNSISLRFVPAAPDSQAPVTEKAYFAGGCFWGTGHLLKEMKGVISTRVGYMGGRTANPTYEQVCGKRTGHAETVEVVYNPTQTSFETLARYFFEIHDPTQIDRQGPDIGDQYRSEIFYVDDTQRQISEKLIDILKARGFNVATRLARAETFWVAEKYHQDYYDRSGRQPNCHLYTKRF